jgi:hypothetical protein
MQKSVFIVPTRGRPQNAKRLLKAWKDTKAVADLYFVCDIDDWSLRDYQAIDDINIITNHITAAGMAQPLNMAAMLLLDDTKYDRYSYFGFLGDDHLPRTDFWDYLLTLQIPGNRQGIAYGNDLLQGANLPTACLMTRGIVENLKGMCQPKAKHLYLDNFWKKLGQDINGLFYSENIVIEHMHPLASKGAMDDHYARVNSEQYYSHDRLIYEDFINSLFYKDLVVALS